MQLFKNYNKTFIFKTNKSKEDIKRKLIRHLRNPVVQNDVVVVNYKPSFFNAFEAKGNLKFSFNDDDSKTKIICEVNAKKEDHYRLYTLIVLYVLFIIVAFIISFTLNTLFIITIGGTIMSLVLWGLQKINQARLKNRASYIFSQIA